MVHLTQRLAERGLDIPLDALREAKSFRVCNCEGCQLDRSAIQ